MALLLLSVFGGSAAEEAAGLYGMVVNAASGKPIGRAQVYLTRHASDDGEPLPEYVAATDDSGRFALSPIPAGTYMVRPERSGYYLAFPGGKQPSIPSIALKPGQQVLDYRLEMLPQAVISGRLLNEDGEPVRQANFEVKPAEGAEALLYFLKIYGASTNDRGEYRMSVPAGSYRLSANVGDYLDDEIRTDGTLPASYAPAWHPNATSSGDARVVKAESGSETSGVDIHLQEVRLSVAGKVTGIPSGASATVSFECLTNRGSFWSDDTTKPDGSFAFGRLQPGRCFAFTHASSGGREMRSAVVALQLNLDPVKDLELTLKPGSDISGVLEMAGRQNVADRVVRLESLDKFMGETYTGTVARDGAFEIIAAAPGRYRVTVQPLPEDSYVQAAVLDGAAVPRQILDLRAGAGAFKLNIAAGNHAARLSGRVEDGSGRPTPVATVYLVPDGVEQFEEGWHKQTGSESSYDFRGIAPGKYRLFALEGYAEPEGPQVLAHGEQLELKEGDRVFKNLKLLTKEAIDGKKQ